MKKKFLPIVIGIMLSVTWSGSSYNVRAEESVIKNIIYMIPDGGGMNPFYLADAFKQAGGWDRKIYPNATVTQMEEMYVKEYLVGGITTHSANEKVTDSAAAGTALSSGYKTKNGYVGLNPDKIPHANILEAAQYVGKNVGIVSTYEWTNATPAAFSAHEKDRGNYPSMSEQIVNQGIDVVLGGGFGAAKWGDISQAEIRGYDIINTKEELNKVKPGDKIWGNIVSGAFPYDFDYGAETPNLAEMTQAAIRALDEGDGFFLMVEGSKVDGGGHANFVRGMISEFLAFDEACKVALQYAEGRDDTVVVIVPDHDTGGMVLPEDLKDAVNDLKLNNEPEDIKWETTGHTSRNGGLFIYIPEGVSYPDGISGNDIGTQKAYEENVVDNTVIAPYLAEFMQVELEELSKELFVDVTDIGTYDESIGLFIFNDYSITVRPNVSYAFVNDEVVDLDGQVTVYANSRFYVPKLLLDIAQGKVDYELCDYVHGFSSYMDTYMPDTTDIERWNGRIYISNFLKDKTINGQIKFTSPDSFSEVPPIDIMIDSKSKAMYEFECPVFDASDDNVVFEYEIIVDGGEKQKFASNFKGLAFSGYAVDEVVIDGNIDEKAWKHGVVMTCDDASRIVNIEDWKGDRDLSGDFSMLWDEEYFYFYAVVTDEDFYTVAPASNLWNGDSVQFGVYHDTENALVNGTAGRKFEEIGLAVLEDEPVAYRFVSQSGETPIGEIEKGDNFDFACKREGNVQTYELKLKWSELFGYEFTPKIGDMLGFSVLLNDNDGAGRRGWMEYGSGIGTSKDVNKFVMMPLLDFSEANGGIQIVVNGETIMPESVPTMINDKVFVPLRAVFEELGAEVVWNGETGTVIVPLKGKKTTLKIKSNEIDVDGVKITPDAPVEIINDRTYVTIGTIATILDEYSIEAVWDGQSQTAIILDK